MSTCANFFILFRSLPTAERVSELEEAISNRTEIPVPIASEREHYGRYVEVYDADLRADVSAEGVLTWLGRERYSPLLGVPSIQGRLFENSTLERHWSKEYSNGPAITHIITALTLLAQPDIEWVWYVSDHFSEGGNAPALTHTSVHGMLDDYIAVGNLTFDTQTLQTRPVKYIWSEGGFILDT